MENTETKYLQVQDMRINFQNSSSRKRQLYYRTKVVMGQ